MNASRSIISSPLARYLAPELPAPYQARSAAARLSDFCEVESNMSAMAVDTAAASTSAGGAQNTTTTNGGSGEERQIAVRLTTKDSAYSIPATKFLVPSSWRRFHLSELINKVLENGMSAFNVRCTPSPALTRRPTQTRRFHSISWSLRHC